MNVNKILKFTLAGIIMILSIYTITIHRTYFIENRQFELIEPDQAEIKKVRLNADNIKPFLFGFAPLVADLIWIYTIVEMDVKLPTIEEYNLYYTLSHLSTDLDPYFEPLYIYASGQFMWGRQGTDEYMMTVDDAQELLLKGWDFYLNRDEDWEHYERYWVIPQFIGFHYYFDYKDMEKALPYYEYIANHVPEAPSLYRTFAAEIYRKLGRKDDNLSFLETALVQESLMQQLALNPENKEIKEKIRRKMIVLQGGEVSQEAVDKYIEKVTKETNRIIRLWNDQYSYLTIEHFLSLHPDLYNEKLSSDVSMLDVLKNINQEAL